MLLEVVPLKKNLKRKSIRKCRASKDISNQYGFGKSRQQKKEKQWTKGDKGKTIYSSKHTRRYEALLDKSKEKSTGKDKGKKTKRGST